MGSTPLTFDLRQHRDALVDAATAAPSQHNTQPWRLVVTADTVEVHGDGSRRLQRSDPTGRSMHLACGAALFNLRLALDAMGAGYRVELRPEPSRPSLLGRITLTPTAALGAVADANELMPFVWARRSHRGPFTGDPLPVPLLIELSAAASGEGARLRWLQRPGERAAVARIVADATRELAADPEYLAELARWTPPPGQGRRDGVPVTSYGLNPGEMAAAPFPMRDFGAANRDWPRTPGVAERDPVVGVLLTDEDAPVDWLRAGAALQHVLLRVTAAGAAAGFLMQPLDLPGSRRRLEEEVADGAHAQALLRFGYGTPPPPVPRRSRDDVLGRTVVDLTDPE